MSEPTVVHSTFAIERSYPHSPERVFAAFADPAIKRRWFAPDCSTADTEHFEIDFRIGGEERYAFRFLPGAPIAGRITNMGTIQDIVPNQRVVTAYTMALDEKRFSASLVTIELLPDGEGTELICTHQGAFFESADGPEMRKDGWRRLLDQLAKALDGASS